jgi:hypothetical protein
VKADQVLVFAHKLPEDVSTYHSPYTGTSAQHGTSYNKYTGQATKQGSASNKYPRAGVQHGASYNRYTGAAAQGGGVTPLHGPGRRLRKGLALRGRTPFSERPC